MHRKFKTSSRILPLKNFKSRKNIYSIWTVELYFPVIRKRLYYKLTLIKIIKKKIDRRSEEQGIALHCKDIVKHVNKYRIHCIKNNDHV